MNDDISQPQADNTDKPASDAVQRNTPTEVKSAPKKAESAKPKSKKPQPKQDNPWLMLVRDCGQWLSTNRFAAVSTACFVALNIVIWIALAFAGHRLPLNELNTTMSEFDLRKLAASLILTRGVLQLLGSAALIMLVLVLSEPRLGRGRTVAVALGSAVGGVALGMGLCFVVGVAYQDIQSVARLRFSLNPVVLVIGALMAASAFSDILWRRRIRIIGYAAILVLLLYGGNPGNYCLLAAALIGHLIGRLLAGSPKRSSRKENNVAGIRYWQRGTSSEARRIFAAIAAIMALGPLTAVTSRNHAGPLSTLGLLMSPRRIDNDALAQCLAGETTKGCFLQFDLVRTSMPGIVLSSLLPTAVMLVLAWGLYRGRRFAAIVTIAVNMLQICMAVVYYLVIPLGLTQKGMGSLISHGALLACFTTILPSLVFSIALLLSIRHFPVAVGWHRLASGVGTMFVTFLACSAVYLIVGLSRPDDFTPSVDAESLLADLPDRFLPIGFLHHSRLEFTPNSWIASTVYQGVGLVFWLVVLAVILHWMKDTVKESDAMRARAGCLVEIGGESMSFMTTWEGNTYWMSPTGRSAIAYRVLSGIALTLTGPFGEPSEWEEDLRGFTRFCREKSLTPVFYSIHKTQRDILCKKGWHAIEVGSEMVVDPRSWKTTGKKWQDIRTAINKANRAGITDVYSTFAEAPADVREQIESISEEWAQDKALPEMKFTLGAVEELRDTRVQLLYAIDADGRVLGVTSWLPTWRDGRLIGWTLDFMRHRTDSPNGIMEFLIARMAQRLHDEGEANPDEAVEFMSLSAAPLAGMDPDRDNTDETGASNEGTRMLHHSLQIVANLMEPAYGFHSLFNFKRKFQPSENPVYVCYRDMAKLPQIGLAVVRAYVPSVTVPQAMGMLKTFSHKS